MSKPFDVTTKHLLEADPRDWLAFLGFPTASPATVIDSDLATITTDADKVIRVDEVRPWLLHVEFQSSREPFLDLRVARYNVILEYQHRLPVQSAVVLLRPEANSRELSGRLRRTLPNGKCYDDFRYHVVKVWEVPVETILAGGLATLPLAPLADVGQRELTHVVQRMTQRIEQEAEPPEARMLWTATYILLGLRYSNEFANQLLQGVRQMKESATYQAILEEGKREGKREGQRAGELQEAKTILLRLGGRKFHVPPNAEQTALIQGLSSLPAVEELTERLLETPSWSELLAEL